MFCYFFIHKKGLSYRTGISEPRGFNHHAVKIKQALALFGSQQLQRLTKVLANRAANATVVHLNDVFLRVIDQDFIVDIFFTKLVFDHSDLLAVRLSQDSLEQRSFSGTQKAGEDGDGNQAHGICLRSI